MDLLDQPFSCAPVFRRKQRQHQSQGLKHHTPDPERTFSAQDEITIRQGHHDADLQRQYIKNTRFVSRPKVIKKFTITAPRPKAPLVTKRRILNLLILEVIII